MNYQHTLDLREAKRRKHDGKSIAAVNRRKALETARYHVRLKAMSGAVVSADDVPGAAHRCLGPAAGSLFKGKEWICVGRKPSARVGNNGREIRTWKMKGAV